MSVWFGYHHYIIFGQLVKIGTPGTFFQYQIDFVASRECCYSRHLVSKLPSLSFIAGFDKGYIDLSQDIDKQGTDKQDTDKQRDNLIALVQLMIMKIASYERP